MFRRGFRRYLPARWRLPSGGRHARRARRPAMDRTVRLDQRRGVRQPTARPPRRRRRFGRIIGLIIALAAATVAVVLALSVVHLLPQFRNPFTETTTDRSSPVVLKSISALSRYEAATGSFQVVVNLDRRVSWLPSFVEGTQTLFVGQGTDIAFVDFSKLKGDAIKVSHNRRSVTVLVPRARLEPAVLNVKRS